MGDISIGGVVCFFSHKFVWSLIFAVFTLDKLTLLPILFKQCVEIQAVLQPFLLGQSRLLRHAGSASQSLSQGKSFIKQVVIFINPP